MSDEIGKLGSFWMDQGICRGHRMVFSGNRKMLTGTMEPNSTDWTIRKYTVHTQYIGWQSEDRFLPLLFYEQIVNLISKFDIYF